MKKFFFAIFLTVVLLTAAVVPAFAQANVPENPETWLSQQVFEPPTCNPMSYEGWVEAEFDPTGGELNHYDLTAQPYQTFIVWGSGVSIDGEDYGRALIVLNGGETGGRWHAVIVDGAYRVGTDQWGFFPKYWQPVLVCLYGGEFPITTVGEWVVKEAPAAAVAAPQTTPEPPAKAEPEVIIQTVEVEKIVTKEVPVEVEKEVKVPTPFIPGWVWWVLGIAGLVILYFLFRYVFNNTVAPDPDPVSATAPAPDPASDDEIAALKRKVSSAKGQVTRAQKALTAYHGTDPAKKASLTKALKTAKAKLRLAEKDLWDAQNPAPAPAPVVP